MRIQAWLRKLGSTGPGRRCRDRRGQALAEAAIVVPVLLLLVVGIIEMSAAWRSYQVITNAVREGARVAVLPTANLDDVAERVRQSVESGGVAWNPDRLTAECFDGDGVLIQAVCGPSATGTEARIRYVTPYTFRLLEPVARLACRGECDSNFGTVMIGSTSTMRNE